MIDHDIHPFPIKERPHCCKVFWREILPCQPWFLVEDPSTSIKLDIPRTFGPWGIIPAFFKFFTCGFVLKTQILSWIDSANIFFYYAYYTSWALAFSSVYCILSFFNSICVPFQPERGVVRGRARLTWILFSLSVFGEALATLVYWTLVHEWGSLDISYLDIANHGLVLLAVCIDGFVICRIPLRWTHIWISWCFLVLFFGWTIIQRLFGIVNPNEGDDDSDSNKDAIYKNISWKEEDVDKSVALSIVCLFIVSPILFGLLRGCSTWSGIFCGRDRRRYITEDETGYSRWA